MPTRGRGLSSCTPAFYRSTMPASSPSSRQNLLLIGGGHAHLEVFRAFHEQPPENCKITLLVDQPTAVYSGMVPGFLAGQYQEDALSFDLRKWAQAMGAQLVLGRAVGMDLDAREVELADGMRMSYDLCSWNIGSAVVGLDVPGVREFALATRPIGDFAQQAIPRLRDAIRLRGKNPLRILVVGGGAAGMEIAFCLDHRALQEHGVKPETTVLYSSHTLLPNADFPLQNAVMRQIKRRGLKFRHGQKIVALHEGEAETWNGERIPFDLCIWATGADAHLADGWIPVGPSLQVENHPEVFAVGDCAHLTYAPNTPKAGVYAVRQGPVLERNLRAMLRGHPMRLYQPQDDFLTLLNLGDGRAVGAKFGATFTGKWVMWMKDWIDRRFMRKYQTRSIR